MSLRNIELENIRTVLNWPKWMQKIIISAHTASTGQFNMTEAKWREWKKYAQQRLKKLESK